MNPEGGGAGGPIPCPVCDHRWSAVKDSRPIGRFIRRRRMCLSCGKRFTTREQVVADGAGLQRGAGAGCWIIISPDGEARRIAMANVGPAILTHLFAIGADAGPIEVSEP